jgi:N-acetylneuraminic acid mutarotase
MRKTTIILLLISVSILLFTNCEPHSQPSRWREIKQDEIHPDERLAGQQVYIGNRRILLFGGLNNPYDTLSDLWEYNIDINEWTEIEKGNPYPPGRYGFQMAFDGSDKIVIYGGVTRNRNIPISDVWEYDINAHKWTEYCTNPDDIKPDTDYRAWSDMCYGGEDSKVIIFGGNVKGETSTKKQNDLWDYDTINHTWTEIVVDGDKPSPRSSHSITYINNKIILFGGWGTDTMFMDDTWEFDLTTNTWQEIDTQGNHPPGRHWNSLAKLNNTTVLLFGGETEENANNNDTWEYDTETKQWTEYTSRNLPEERLLTTMCYGGNDNVIMFGGDKPEGSWGDLWEYSHENEEE